MLTLSGNRYSVVLGRDIQYSLGEGTFSGRVSSRVIISYLNIGGVVVGGRLSRTTAVHGSHANIPHSWRIPASRQGFNVLFGFIHQGRSVHLFLRVFGAVGGCLPVWRVFGGVGGPLSVPTCFGLDMSIRGA